MADHTRIFLDIETRAAERFWPKVEKGSADDCWPWTGYLRPDGYGEITMRPKKFSTHRLSWILAHGPIPEGMSVCHRCDNPACVNPAHLFLGTQQDNMRDAQRKGRHTRGEKAGPAGLTREQVVEIRERYAAGGVYQRELAEEFGITQGTVSYVVNNKTWDWLEEGAA